MAQQSFATFVVALALLVQLCTCQDQTVTCRPQNPLIPGDSVGFKGCLFNTTNNQLTDTIEAVANFGFSTQAKLAFIAGECYCKQDCNPSQVVCNNPRALSGLLPPELNINIINGLAEIAYVAENWHFFCYCPQHVPEGVDPCARPSNPDICKP